MRSLIWFLSVCSILTAPAWCVEEKRAPAGVTVLVAGEVNVVNPEAKSRHLKLGQTVYPGDRIKTGANGRASVVLIDGTQLKLNYNTDIILRDKTVAGLKSARGIGSVKMFLGNLWSKVTKKDAKFEFETPSAVAAVKGSSGLLDVADQETCIKWFEGKLLVSNEFGKQEMDPMTQACIAKGFAPPPPKPIVVNPKATPTPGWYSGEGYNAATWKLKVIDEDGSTKELILQYEK